MTRHELRYKAMTILYQVFLYENNNIDYNVDTAKSILNNNLVCSNFFKWDYENWCPIKENKCEALF